MIKFYGATHCHDCVRSKSFLDDRGVVYDYINIDQVIGAADEVVKINNGLRSTPTIVFPNGMVLVEPSNEELKRVVDSLK